jgi:precorrin-3B methylase
MLKLTVNLVKEILSKIKYQTGDIEVYENTDNIITIMKNYEYRNSGVQYMLEACIVKALDFSGFSLHDFEVISLSDNWFKNSQSFVKIELQVKG